MSARGQELFNEYLLELLADAEKRADAIDAHIGELTARALAADIRMGEVEDEVGELRSAFAQRLIVVK